MASRKIAAAGEAFGPAEGLPVAKQNAPVTALEGTVAKLYENTGTLSPLE
jgi:hypothetical protein